jgi:L-asparaginase II
VKIDDGAKRAAEAVTEAIIQTYVTGAPALGALGTTRNWVGHETGATRLADTARRALAV